MFMSALQTAKKELLAKSDTDSTMTCRHQQVFVYKKNNRRLHVEYITTFISLAVMYSRKREAIGNGDNSAIKQTGTQDDNPRPPIFRPWNHGL